jgi:chemotaxis protein CheD
MVSPHDDLPVVVLAPGDLVFVKRAHVLVTVLGSCVSVTMRHRTTGYASMCHAMLPEMNARHEAGREPRFLDRAMDHMVTWFAEYGMPARELEVKAFGGADVLPQLVSEARRRETVGAQNIRMTETLLTLHRLTAVAFDLGGVSGRKIYFDTNTGDVFVRRVGSARP